MTRNIEHAFKSALYILHLQREQSASDREKLRRAGLEESDLQHQTSVFLVSVI